MSNQLEALRLAIFLDDLAEIYTDFGDDKAAIENKAAAKELRRLHEVNQELYEALERFVCTARKPIVDSGQYHEVWVKARAALAKARGEE